MLLLSYGLPEMCHHIASIYILFLSHHSVYTIQRCLSYKYHADVFVLSLCLAMCQDMMLYFMSRNVILTLKIRIAHLPNVSNVPLLHQLPPRSLSALLFTLLEIPLVVMSRTTGLKATCHVRRTSQRKPLGSVQGFLFLSSTSTHFLNNYAKLK